MCVVLSVSAVCVSVVVVSVAASEVGMMKVVNVVVEVGGVVVGRSCCWRELLRELFVYIDMRREE